ncbi:YjbF family lipoprotein [Alteromonas sp. H39]|uniref:YjbF family lipoprotein n=1 Tax=Alteromonas sp. H39 TaxID=3389876 RepID=UPI0039E029F0
MNVIKIFSLFLIMLLLLSGCSATNRAYIDTLSLAFSDRDIQLTKEQVAQSGPDLLQIKSGERPVAVMGLAFIENDHFKWVSADSKILTMHHGVIIKTHGLDNDLLYTAPLATNPLAGDSKLAFSWERRADIEGLGYGLPINSKWRIEGEDSRTFFDTPFDVLHISERVSFADTSPYFDMDLEWENHYWLDLKTKTLLASKQKYAPDGDWYDMVYLSRVVRLMEGAQ